MGSHEYARWKHISDDSKPAEGSGESLRLMVFGIARASRTEGAQKNWERPGSTLGPHRSYTSKANRLYSAGDGRTSVVGEATKLVGMTCSTRSFGFSTFSDFKENLYDSKSIKNATHKRSKAAGFS